LGGKVNYAKITYFLAFGGKAMRFQHYINCIVAITILVIIIGCTANQGRNFQQTIIPSPKQEDKKTEKIPPDICNLLTGDWRTFETPQGVERRMCGELPCGYRGPLKLNCLEGKITGSKLLIYASSPSPEREIRASIEASWSNEKLILTYTNNQKCLITYTVSVKGADLVGQYSRRDCGDKDEEGEFFAKKFPSR
jgi:hypothetical protein